MNVPFNNIPSGSGLRVPLFYAEVNNSQANTAGFAQRALIIGQILSGAAATPNVPVLSPGPGGGAALGGVGSMIDAMMQAYGANDSFGETWFLPLSDASGSTAASGSIAFSGTTTAAGTLALYIAGLLVAVPIASGSAAAAVATAVAAAINVGVGTGPDGASWNLPVTATASSGTVTITARNAGAAGNDLDLRINYRGTAGGEVTPPGITVTITALSGGATNPILTTALANLVDMAFDFIVSPYTDSTSIAALSALLNDTTGRWSWQTQVYGQVFMAYRGTFSALGTFGNGLNDQHTTCMGVYGSPSWVAHWAAAYAGAAAVALRADPAAPLQTVPIAGVRPPPVASKFSLSQRNTLLFDGISTFSVARGGQVAIENAITTYQLNGSGQPDNSYLELETMFTLMAVLRALAGAITSNFARSKLAANGTPIPPGSNIVTPAIIRGYLIAEYIGLENQGLVQSAGFFAANVVVQQNPTNPNRVDVLWPGVLIDQLRVFALLAQFRLIAPTTGSAGTAAAALA